MSECDREASIMRRPWPTGGCCAMKYYYILLERSVLNRTRVERHRAQIIVRTGSCAPEALGYSIFKGVVGPLCFLGVINMENWSSRLGVGQGVVNHSS